MQNGAIYTPGADSLPGRMIAFFKANPGELLTLDDISTKFDSTRGSIHTLLSKAREAGLLQREQNDDGDYLYKAGAKLPTAPAAGSVVAKVHRRPKRAFDVDLSKLELVKDVPLPVVRNAQRNWNDLLDRMEVGDSAELPDVCRSSLAKHIKTLEDKPPKFAQPRKFEIRRNLEIQTLRIWRTA
jgi:hypothetical protein